MADKIKAQTFKKDQDPELLKKKEEKKAFKQLKKEKEQESNIVPATFIQKLLGRENDRILPKDKLYIKIIKFFFYLLGKAAFVAIAVYACIYGFRTAVNSAQVYMIGRDAFSKRTSVILNPSNENVDKQFLDGLFTSYYLSKTNLKNNSKNSSYIIKTYDLETRVPITVVWGWKDEIDIEIVNKVHDIAWDFNPTVVYKTEVDEFIESGTYKVHFVKQEDGRWRVNGIELIEYYDSPTAHPTKYEDMVQADVTMGEEHTGTAEDDTPAASTP